MDFSNWEFAVAKQPLVYTNNMQVFKDFLSLIINKRFYWI